MSVYQYANNPATTLAGSVTAGATSISVTSAADFPAQGKFTIIVDSEIMLVTGVAGTVWTVERGAEDTVAASHTNNSVVTGILTVGSFLNSSGKDVRVYGAKGDGATDDTAAIQAALDDLVDGEVLHLVPGCTYRITSALTPSVSFHLNGHGAKMLADANIDSWFVVIGIDNWTIEDVFFDDNLKAMTIINVNTANHFRISGCRFSNFFAYSTPITSQGAIRLQTAVDAIITENQFVEFGQQYADSGTNPDALPRCVALNAGCTDISIVNNVFKDINTGLVTTGVSSGGRFLIDGNIFTNVNDNAIYCVQSTTDTLISNNMFVRTASGDFDEAIVISSGTNISIRGNYFKEIPNKAIAYTGTCDSIVVSDNVFIKNDAVETGGNALAARATTDVLTNFIFSDNLIVGTQYNSPVVQFRGLSYAVIVGNRFHCENSAADATQIRFDNSNNEVLIANNSFRNSLGTASGNYGVRMDTATACTNFTIEGNVMQNTCIRWTGHDPAVRDQALVSVSTRLSSPVNKIVWFSAAPTQGNWLRGDIVYNTSPAASGTIGWVCTSSGTPGTWKTWGTISA